MGSEHVGCEVICAHTNTLVIPGGPVKSSLRNAIPQLAQQTMRFPDTVGVAESPDCLKDLETQREMA